MSERPEFIGPAGSQESVFSRGGQDPSVQQDPPPPGEDDLPETVPAPRQDPPVGADGAGAPGTPAGQEDPGEEGRERQAPGEPSTRGVAVQGVLDEPTALAPRPVPPQTAQPFPNASNYRDPSAQAAPSFADPGASAAPAAPPVAPPGNYWQPRQASSSQFQAAQGHGAPGWYDAQATGQAGGVPGPAPVTAPGTPSPGYAAGNPQAPLPAVPYPAASGPYFELGPILIRGDRVITPNGTIPLAQAQFSFQNLSRTTKSTPTWAIVLAIVLVWFFLLSLLLLIVQEEQTTGQVIISVVGGEGAFAMTVPVTSQAQVGAWAQQVQYAQMIAAQARA